jgi:cytochrome c5
MLMSLMHELLARTSSFPGRGIEGCWFELARKLIFVVLLTPSFPVAGLAATVANNISLRYPEYPPVTIEAGADKAQIERGEYLVKLGDCMACHTDTKHNGAPFAGGLKIDTPYGAIFTPNITPDKAKGIGNWSDEQFVTAVREGISPSGSYYYPVFPYNYFNRMSRKDVLAIKAYLDRIPAQKHANRPAQMRWPFKYRWLQFGWRLLYFYFDRGVYENVPARSANWNRGAFIVQGPGHCSLCHTELNMLGVPKEKYYLAGAFVDDYYAPDITARGLQHLPPGKVADIFKHNVKPTGGRLLGPMSDVEHDSLRYLNEGDMLAIADYLKSVASDSPPEEGLQTPLNEHAGYKLYESNCRACHETGVVGAPEVDKQKVRKILRNQGRKELYRVAIEGDGPMPPKGGCNICSAARVEAAVDYMIRIGSSKKSDKP